MSPMPSRTRMLWLACALVLAATLQRVGSARADAPSTGETGGGLPKCVEVAAQASNRGYGFDHVVEIKNGCDKPASCVISTAVSDPVARTVAAGQTERVLLQRGSPSPTFSPDVTCKLGS
jgi:hypothetical protein